MRIQTEVKTGGLHIKDPKKSSEKKDKPETQPVENTQEDLSNANES